MKKIIVLVAIMLTGLGFSQNGKPTLEAEGQLVKATYFYDNGKVQQVGYFKDGKLDGKWTSYDESGTVKAVAEYKDGEKSGKWVFLSGAITTKEVDYASNQVVAVRDFKTNTIADKN
jgi:antitoxin component YwqK of YwqJK toxin-antitoxin module